MGVIFPISGQPFIEANCHNSRTSNDTDVKPGPVTKLDLLIKNHGNIKKVWRWRYNGICDVIVIFWIYGQFEAIRKSESGWLPLMKIYIFINSNLMYYKNWKQD